MIITMTTTLYTFDNVINFDKTNFQEKIKHFNVKIIFSSYSFDNQLKLIFDKIISSDQEFELLDLLV